MSLNELIKKWGGDPKCTIILFSRSDRYLKIFRSMAMRGVALEFLPSRFVVICPIEELESNFAFCLKKERIEP
ncbi:MAG: hypothetical protein QXG08_06350 [Candidatus Methanomethyliaceae archaeon]